VSNNQQTEARQLTAREDKLLREIERQDEEMKGRLKRLKKSGVLEIQLNTALVIASIVAATVAGATAIPKTGSWRWVAVGAGFAAAFLGGLAQAFDFPKKARVNFLVYNRYGRWCDALHRLKRDIGHVEYEDAEDRLEILMQERWDIAEIERAPDADGIASSTSLPPPSYRAPRPPLNDSASPSS
jgi:hypothetical protein